MAGQKNWSTEGMGMGMDWLTPKKMVVLLRARCCTSWSVSQSAYCQLLADITMVGTCNECTYIIMYLRRPPTNPQFLQQTFDWPSNEAGETSVFLYFVSSVHQQDRYSPGRYSGSSQHSLLDPIRPVNLLLCVRIRRQASNYACKLCVIAESLDFSL